MYVDEDRGPDSVTIEEAASVCALSTNAVAARERMVSHPRAEMVAFLTDFKDVWDREVAPRRQDRPDGALQGITSGLRENWDFSNPDFTDLRRRGPR